MSQTPEAASSPAEIPDVFQGQEVSLAEFNKYRADGEVPERFKPTDQNAESETAATQEETEETESEGSEEEESESETDAQETQEQVPESTAKRIKQLLADRHASDLEKEELRRKLAAATKTDAKPESSTPVAPQHAFPKPKADDKNPDGTLKYAEYEDLTEAIGRWAAREERATWEHEQIKQQALNALKTTLDEARERYDDADEVIFPASQAIHNANIPVAVKEVFSQSANFIDLCYVVGSDPDELKKFIALAERDPRAAIGKVFEYERGIQEELSKNGTQRDDKGKFVAPEKKKTTAPKPPSTVGGSSAKAFDVSDESLSPEEWMRKRNADVAKRS